MNNGLNYPARRQRLISFRLARWFTASILALFLFEKPPNAKFM